MVICTHFASDEIDRHGVHSRCSCRTGARPRWMSLKRRSTGRCLQRVHKQAVLSTRCDVLADLDRQFQSRCRLGTRNARLASGAGAFDERSELQLERLLVFNADSVSPNLFSNAAIDFAGLILIIERKIRVFLENAYFA